MLGVWAPSYNIVCVLLAFGLKPLAEVERALLVVEVLHLPHPKLLGLLGGREHFLHTNKHMC